jgi:hypothetical protein
MYGQIDTSIQGIDGLQTTTVTFQGRQYDIVRYNKDILTRDQLVEYGMYRSVIRSHPDGKILCIAPKKALSPDIFVEKYPSLQERTTESMVVSEFVEGTMINVFWDNRIGLTGGWEIATRNTVGGNCRFFKDSVSTQEQKTFRQMFLETCEKVHISLGSGSDDNTPTATPASTSGVLDKKYCYSFVMQHPENRIVVPFHECRLYLIDVFEIDQESGSVYSRLEEIQAAHVFSSTCVCFPTKESPLPSYSQLVDTFASPNTPYHIMGTVIENRTTWERTKIRNPMYEQVKQLRGNQAKLQYQYLVLRRDGRVKDFLQYYPEKSASFRHYRDQVHLFTLTLYRNYVDCFIAKKKTLAEFPLPYRKHMAYLHHAVYLRRPPTETVVGEHTTIKRKPLILVDVIQFINTMEPAWLMYSINYPFRVPPPQG